jgi:uncharacterized membrane protein YgcG
MNRTGLGFLAIALFVTIVPGPLAAQDAAGWQAFFGCWTPANSESTGVLCFSPAGEGVELVTVLDGEVVASEVLIADGQERIVEAEECMGSRAVRFSSDLRRVFTRSPVACPGDARSGTGVMAFVSPTRWVDVRSLELAGEPAVWAEEYRPVDRTWYADNRIRDAAAADVSAVRDMRLASAEAIGTGDVREALSEIDAVAVEAWIAVQPVAFDLDGDEIVRLVDDGVPESVIDVMVARSFPERFSLSIEGETTVTEVAPGPDAPRFPARPPSYSAFYVGGYRSYLFDPFFLPGISPYGFYGYVTYPYGFWPGRSVYYRDVPSVIVVEPRDTEPESQGRIVNGQGYRRNRPSPAVDARSSGSSVSPATAGRSTTASSSGGSMTPSGASSSGASDGGSSSGGTSSGTSSGTATGRTARPRN